MSPHLPPSPLRCWQVLRALQSYLDGVADEVTSRTVAGHLEECHRCGLEADTYRAIKGALANHERPNRDAVSRLRTFGEALLRVPANPPDESAAADGNSQ